MLNAEISTRKDKAISRGVGMQTQIYADRAKELGSLGCGGESLHRFRRRHCRREHWPLPSESHDGSGAANGVFHPYLSPSAALRELRPPR